MTRVAWPSQSPPDAAAGSVPPQNLEAETSVLGAILLTEQALDGVLSTSGLRPERLLPRPGTS